MGIGNKIRRHMARFDELSATARENGYSKAYLMADFARAYIVHGSTITDYFLYEFYKLNHRGRKQFVTLRSMLPIVRHNPKEAHPAFNDKDVFLERFDAFVHRDWIGRVRRGSREEFDAFCDKHSEFVVKPRCGNSGDGIHKVSLAETDREALWREMTENDEIAEELIVQCPEMAAIHPGSVNTVRPFTIHGKLVSAVTRLGVGGSFVDNGDAGGIFAEVDPETGVITGRAANTNGQRFLRHPTTGVVIPGFQIPQWDKVKKLVAEVTALSPEVVLAGWDVAITSDGPIIVEGNAHPGPQIMQGSAPRGLKRTWHRALEEK